MRRASSSDAESEGSTPAYFSRRIPGHVNRTAAVVAGVNFQEDVKLWSGVLWVLEPGEVFDDVESECETMGMKRRGREEERRREALPLRTIDKQAHRHPRHRQCPQSRKLVRGDRNSVRDLHFKLYVEMLDEKCRQEEKS